MLISHSKQFIFIHIYKTAGTSVTKMLIPYARVKDRMVYDDTWPTKKVIGLITKLMHWEDSGHRQFTGFHKHEPIAEVKTKLPSEQFDNYYKFCFVRNPFDWLVSFYEYIKQTPRHRLKQFVESQDFNNFVAWYISQAPSKQVDFLWDPETEQVLVDHIGYFEDLENDIAKIVDRLELSSKRTLSHKNPSKHRKKRSYKDYYTDDTIALVEDYFEKDLSILGYAFEGRVIASASPH